MVFLLLNAPTLALGAVRRPTCLERYDDFQQANAEAFSESYCPCGVALGDRLTETCGAQCVFIGTATVTTVGKSSIDDHGGYGSNAETLDSSGHRSVGHLEDVHLA